MDPVKPKNISTYAQACLEELAAEGCGHMISIGGAVALSYFLEYRETHDVDAWWKSTSQTDRRRVIDVIEKTLGRLGTVRTRSWGDVISVELTVGGKTMFTFQIASRSAELDDPGPAPWPEGLLLDSFNDLLASKMAALIDRGAPRDFRDIHAVCGAGLASPALCWSLWKRRRELAGDDSAPSRARLAVLTHLERLELHRPLDKITNHGEKGQAERVREWFRGVFIDAGMA